MSELLLPEIFSKPELWLIVIASTPILAMAFSRMTRNKMIERSGGYDEVTGLPIKRGEAAHFNHDKKSEEYDSEDNGLFVSSVTHWWMHLLDDEDNGLNSAQNRWARDQISKRMYPTKEEKVIFGRWLKNDE